MSLTSALKQWRLGQDFSHLLVCFGGAAAIDLRRAPSNFGLISTYRIADSLHGKHFD
jgi:hypothetical protein